ncbi:conjugal transfer protein [Phenylobacterium zucineum HLK1]|uniref:Conjugal transfer protein n=2 Tax=Phenylobacterium TaxID=20 RepID=B4RAC3_PHEZH|nr:P-type conjugative transfer protein TrbG [Phenylobacterium zucineum]ACG77930.1 conjugal transfer protein [Phenylobacterium zucineum HLK1]
MRAPTLILMLAGTTLSGCAAMQAEQSKPASTVPATAPALAPAPVPRGPIVVASTPVPNPPERAARKPAAGPVRPAPETGDPAARVARANAAARVQPTGSAYANAAQIYPYAEGALFQVYTAPGRITDITLEEGETLSGTGPVAAGDTARWIIGDTESGSGASRRVHILVKPTRADLQTNLVINTNRRTYHLELRATPATYMASVAWRYPADEALAAAESVERYAAPTVAIEQLNFNYRISGDRPSWRPVRVFDDGRQTFIEFAPSVTQGELPPLFVGGADGKAADLVNYRVSGQRMVVDRLFTRAELRLGDRRGQKRVRIERGAGG